MPLINFARDTASLTFSQGRAYPLDDPLTVGVVTGETEAGQLYAYAKGPNEREFLLTFDKLPRVDADAFAVWHATVAVGPLNVFAYTDETGATRQVRLMDIKYPLREVASGLFSGTIRLREEI